MNYKNKILVVFAMTVLIVAGGIFVMSQLKNTEEQLYTAWNQKTFIIPLNEAVSKPAKGRRPLATFRPRIVKPIAPLINSPSFAVAEHSFDMKSTAPTGYVASNGSPVYNYLYKRSKRDEDNYSAHSGLIVSDLGFYGSGKTGSSESATSYMASTMPSMTTAPLGVPFQNSSSGPPRTTPGGTILFDPGVETESIESNTVPVGDGLWVVFALSIGYVVLRSRLSF